jgi:hypothetical protein
VAVPALWDLVILPVNEDVAGPVLAMNWISGCCSGTESSVRESSYSSSESFMLMIEMKSGVEEEKTRFIRILRIAC